MLELFDEKQLESFEFIEIDLLNKPEWFLRLNPVGQVPVLQYGDKIMVESLSICEYMLNIHDGHNLLPTDAFEMYKLRAFIERFTATISVQFYRILRAHSKEQLKSAKSLLLTSLATVKHVNVDERDD